MKLLSMIGCGVLLAGFAGACLASGDQGATTVPEILQMQHALRTKLESPTGEYSRFDEASVRKMEAAQDQVFHMLSGVTSLDQLSEQQKVDLSNALDQVKATLLAQEDKRVICHIERKIGTNLTSRRCETVAQREADTAEARRMMDHNEIGR
ncbi:hypothetical protein [Cognatiluteimonas profundi]|uniref:hypothetical protein n=1 Tax=Cognatiluteimonas profundi TaxID=2594501 RepID=UPI00131AB502|nr:hypothetical protein [Lysobacter profundi]